MSFDCIPVNKAKQIALYTNVRRARIATIAFLKNGKIITSAYNRRVDGRHWEWTEHAEVGILNKLNKLCAFQRYSDINILVIRIFRKTKKLGMAKPCPCCRKKLNKYPINSIWYSDENGKIRKLK